MGKPLLFLTLILLTVSCGKQVQISTKKLESNSKLSDGSEKTSDQTGTLKRGRPDKITTDGSTYPVSIYSSHQALEFIAAKPLTTVMDVKFKGTVKDSEMVLSIMESK